METAKKAKFISLEGIEGVGKSSNMHFLAQKLEQRGHNVVKTREPGGTPMAEAIRSLLLSSYVEKTLPKTELLLLYAARLQHVTEVISPALANNQWVLCDRFCDATYAYQGGGRQLGFETVDILNHWALGDFAPDHVIVLDAPVEIAFSRIAPHRQLDRFEQETADFFERIRKAYLLMAARDPKRYSIVDASQTIDAVQSQLADIIQRLS